MRIPRIGFRSRLAAAAVVVTLAGGGAALAAASPAAAYGPTQVYSIHLSANVPGPHGGGIWLWFGLNSDGSGDYTGSDCGHNNGHAVPDNGNVTSWTTVGSNVVISGVALNGLGYTATVTVPAATGHYTGTFGTYTTLPPFIQFLAGAGFSELQVAP